MDFSGKNVWVTGAGKGIGYATALAFVEAGAKVTGFDQAFTQEQYPFATEVMDVADAAQVAQVCQRLLAETERLDALVSAAFNLSRAESARLFEAERVFVNGLPAHSASSRPEEGDMVSVRGLGRFRFEGALGETRKGRLRVSLRIYGR